MILKEMQNCGTVFYDTESGIRSFEKILNDLPSFQKASMKPIRRFQEAIAYPVSKKKFLENIDKKLGYVIVNCSSIMLNFSGTRENNLKCKRKDGQIIRIPEVNEHRRVKHTAQDHREHPFLRVKSIFGRSRRHRYKEG